MLAVPVSQSIIRRDLGGTVSRERAAEIIRFGNPFVFAGLGYWLLTSLDRWMLAELADATEVGLYSVAAKFASAVFLLNAAFGQAWSPFAMRMRRDRADYRDVYASVGAGWFFVLAWVGCVLAVFAPELLALLTPPAYHAAAFPMALLAMGSVLFGTTQITAVGISLSRRTHLFVRATWAVAGLNFVLNLLLIPIAGATGAALATVGSYGGLTALYLYWSQRLHPLPLSNPKFAYSLLCCCAALALTALPAGPVGVMLKLGFLATAIWFAFRLKVVELSELKMPATPESAS
jgi:O-antigen/teichoic acid export membrane protein